MEQQVQIKSNCAGQSLIECSLLTLVVVPLVWGILSFCYLYFAKSWINHHVHEALVCAASLDTSTSLCRRTSLGKIAHFLPFGKVAFYSLNKNNRNVSACLKFLAPMHIEVEEKQQINLPLGAEL